MKRVAAKIGLALFAALLALAGGEVILRLIAHRTPPRIPWKPEKIIGEVGDNLPGIKGRVEFTINSIGLRGDESWQTAKRKILCIGGSTTICRFVPDKKTWPWALQLKLKDTFVGNAGRVGQFMPHHIYQLNHYTLAGEFDTIILLAGFNDLGYFMRERYEEHAKTASSSLVKNPFEKLQSETLYLFGLFRKKPDLASEGAVVFGETDGWIVDSRKLRREAEKKGILTEPPPGLANVLKKYGEYLTEFIRLCRSREQRPILMTQPSVYQETMAPDIVENCYWGYYVETDKCYDYALMGSLLDQFNRVMLDTCEKEKAECIDLTKIMPKNTRSFYDDCHFNIEGCERVASTLTEHLLEEKN